MLCVLVTKDAYQSLTWPLTFADLVARGDGCTMVVLKCDPLVHIAGSPGNILELTKATPENHALLYEHPHTQQVYLALQRF